jgi:hypothetical protein
MARAAGLGTVRSVTSPARTALAFGLLAVLASAACSSRTGGRGSSTAPTDPVVAAVTSIWVPVRDVETGITFGLPGQPEVSRTQQRSTNGGPDIERRQYLVFVNLVQLSVTIDSGVGKPVQFGDPAAIATGLAAQSRARGDRNVQIVDRKQVDVQGRPGLDFRLTYTPKKWATGTVSEFVRAVQARQAMVVMHTFYAPPSDASPSIGPALQAKLVAGLTLA